MHDIVEIKFDKKPNHIYCINGDGELKKEQIWEVVMTGGKLIT
jgi:transketolase N-terminal domain/subunit